MVKQAGVAAWLVGIAALVALTLWCGVDAVGQAIASIGWGILLSYLPLYWYRKKIEDPKYAEEAPPAAIPSPGS